MMPDCTHCPLHDLLTRGGIAERVTIWHRSNEMQDMVHLEIWGDTVEAVTGEGATVADAVSDVAQKIRGRGGL